MLTKLLSRKLDHAEGLTNNRFGILRRCKASKKWLYALWLLATLPLSGLQAQTVTIGTGTDVPNNTLYGPIYRYSSTSGTDGARVNMLWSAAEMAAAGIPNGAFITSVEFNKTNAASFNGTIPFQMLVANSSDTILSTSDTWADVLATHTEVINDASFNVPQAAGWVTFNFNTPFTYTGGAFEVATQNDASALSQPRSTDGFEWQYTSGFSDFIAGVANPSGPTLSGSVSSYKHRPNIRISYIPPTPCTTPPTAGTAVTSDTVICAGLNFSLNLSGNSLGTGQTYQWEVSPDGTTNWTPIGTSSNSPYFATSQSAGTFYYRNAVTCSGNTAYSTVVSVLSPSQPTGTFTINKNAPASATNFQSVAAAIDHLSCGIGGPVTFDVVAGSGPYNEQVVISEIRGASSTNTITFNGNANTLSFDPTSSDRYVIRLDGADHIVINDFNIETTDATYGWGIHFINSADSNAVSNNTITIGSTSSTESNSVGIVFSNSTSSVTSGGDNGNNNLITNNTITGGFKGIHLNSTTSAAGNNQITNNVIKDFYSYGMEISAANATLVESNDISRPARSSVGTFYGIYAGSDSRNTVINKNSIHNTHGGASSLSGTVYAIYFTGADASTGSENIVKNNLIYDINNTGTVYGLYNSSSDGAWYYHNTIYIKRSSVADGLIRAVYQTLSASDIEYKNNIIYLDDAGTDDKFAFYFGNTSSTIASNNNVVYFPATATNSYVGDYSVSFTTLADWQTANGGIYDQNSVFANPMFADPANADFTPVNVAINNIGQQLTAVTEDYAGVTRNATPDPGAFEFTPSGDDAAIVAIDSPVSPIVPGVSTPIQATISNYGLNNLTTAVIGWSVDGVAQPSFNWTGNLTSLQEDQAVTIGNFTFAAGTHTVTIWSSLPNGVADPNTMNDTMQVTIDVCVPASGVYTINDAQPTGGTNFASFSDAFSQLGQCGISANVTLDVVANSGPYIEQVEIPFIPGSNNFSVTVNGHNNMLTYAPDNSLAPHIIRFNGAQNITLDSLQIVVPDSADYGWGIHLTNNADFNVISNNTITIPQNSSSNDFNGIVASGSVASVTAGGNTTNSTLIQNNTISGGYYGIRINGDANAAIGNLIVENTITDFYQYGVYVTSASAVKVISNEISRPARTSVGAFYGIYLSGDITGAFVAKNRIHDSFTGDQSSTSINYGIYTSGVDAPTGSENYFINNLLYAFNGNGTTYGIYNSGSDGAYYYNNTISLDHVSSATTSNTRGFYQSGTASNIEFKNNIVSITRGSAGPEDKVAVYFGTLASSIESNNNVFYVNSAQPDNYIGVYGSGGQSTLAAWQSLGFDSASVVADPMFTNPATGNFQPTNLLINNIAVPFALVQDDINGDARDANTPDPGAYEFTVQGLDASIAWIAPVFGGAAGNKQITVEITNTKTTAITSLDLSYTDGTSLVDENFAGLNIAAGATQQFTFTTPYNLTGNAGLYAYIRQVNGRVDDDQLNDTTGVQAFCTALVGNYTIDAATTTGGTNFRSFTDAVQKLNDCGVDGPVTFTVAPNSGPYNEQVELLTIQGASATNTVVFNGNGNALAFQGTSSDRHVLKLNGAKHVTIDSLVINALDATYGWGIALTNEADSNSVVNSVINISSTSTSSNNSAGIVATNSSTSVSSTGNNANNLVIMNNEINGGYYGIRLNGSSTFSTYNNQITGNEVKDFYTYGIYVYYGDSVLIEGNDISRPTRASVSSFYGVYLSTGNQNAMISKNKIHNGFDADPGSSSNAYPIYLSSSDAPQGSENRIVNNLIYNINNNSNAYALYNSSSSGAFYYHNTVVLDDTAATTSSDARGFYQTTTADNIEVKNNIFYITRSGSGDNYGLYFGSSGSDIVSDNNVFYITGTDPYIGYYLGNQTTLADWQQANTGTYDLNSVVADPMFVDAAQADFEPQNKAMNDLGAFVGVTEDINGTTRSTTSPDAGAIEFTIIGRDASIAWIAPVPPMALGNQSIVVEVTNILTTPITSLRLAYTDGVTTETENFTGLNITNGNSQQFTFTTPYNLASLTQMRAYIINVNGTPDDDQLNDTTNVQTLCASLAGNYTINSALASTGTNFQNFTDAAHALNSCGVNGPVTFTVTPGSGPYTDRLVLNEILGASAANTVTISGNGAELSFAGDTDNRSTVMLNGADYITIDSLVINATDATYGWGIHFTDNADHNIIRNSTINVASTSTTASNSAGIVVSSSATSTTATGDNGNYNTIMNNAITGGYYGIRMNGGSGAIGAVGNQVVNNMVQDFRAYGISLDDADSTLVSGNDISRPTRTSVTTFYGMALSGLTRNSVVEKNRIHNPFGGDLTSTSSTYAIWSSANDASFGEENILKNNLVYDINGEGTQYGVYNSSSNGTHYYHNTIVLADTNTAVTRATRGFYQTTTASNIEFYNNIVVVTRAGTGTKHAIYLNSTGSTIASDNNVLYVTGAFGTGVIGHLSSDFTTLADWQGAGFGVNSISVDPQFVNAAAGNLEPTNPALDNIGRALADVTTDILGNPRSTVTPDAGAYEVTLIGVKPDLSVINQVVAWPNPFADNVSVKFTGHKTGEAKLLVRDAIGQVVYEQSYTIMSGANQLQVNLDPALSKGLYFLSIEVENQQYVIKLVK